MRISVKLQSLYLQKKRHPEVASGLALLWVCDAFAFMVPRLFLPSIPVSVLVRRLVLAPVAPVGAGQSQHPGAQEQDGTGVGHAD